MIKMGRHGGRASGRTDRLVEESEILRQELLRTAARLEVFANELIGEAQQLRDEAASASEGDGDGRREDTAGTADPGSGPAGTPDPDGPGDQL